AGGFGLLSAVRVAGQGATDRIVFEFAEAVPGYRISYVDLPVTSDPAGEEVPLAGSAALQISLIGSSAYREVGDAEPAFPVPRRLSGDTSQVTELVNLGDFERVLVWAAGVRERTGFTVTTLDAPPRLVIDVAR
ncbi:AMIN-like domain-containing (lipo)protein, partial [Pseudonocardia abyssalis]